MTRTLGMDVRGLLNPNVTGAVIDGPAVRPLNVEQVHFADAAESHDSGSAFCLVCHATPLTGYSRVARLVLGCPWPSVCARPPERTLHASAKPGGTLDSYAALALGGSASITIVEEDWRDYEVT